jgi:hypothetical protein
LEKSHHREEIEIEIEIQTLFAVIIMPSLKPARLSLKTPPEPQSSSYPAALATSH